VAGLVSIVRKSIQNALPGPSVAILDWAELPWGQHEASSFLEKIGSSLRTEKSFGLPIVHINVPKELLLLSEKAVFSYTRAPQLPMCAFLEGGDEWYWLGLPTPERGWGPSRYATDDPEARNEHAAKYLRKVFDDILTGRQDGRIPHGTWQGSRELALRYVERTDLFEEGKARDISTGHSVPSGQFRPKLSYEKLRSIIAGTFISVLRDGLESDSCCFPPQEEPKEPPKRKKRKSFPPLVRLPNGMLVDRFYRCDGLLDYSPQARRSASDADFAAPGERFRDMLVAHLVDLAKALESHTPGRFDLVVSCTSPTHWFVHQLADGLSDRSHRCGHFVGATAASFAREFHAAHVRRAAKVLVFTDVVSTGGLVTSMVRTLDNAGLQVKGLIGLLNTRTRKKSANAQSDDTLTRLVDRENTAFLVHIPVEKKPGGRIGWRVDPETLEPIPVGKQSVWTDTLAGIGPMALDGKHVAHWLEAFEAVRYGHLTHGGHHSEFICNVKRLLTRPEVRARVTGRLNLYIRENDIDMIVYPNHSNAYLMADMIRELHGSESRPPTMKVALCRDNRGERSYVLPGVSVADSPQTLMLLDDGFVSGSTMRSLAAAVVEKYPRVKEIHVVVFLNEMMPAVARYWTTLAASSTLVPRKTSPSKRAFMAPKLNFSSVMSLPNRSYAEDNCPLCRQQKEYLRYSKDEARSVRERDFFRLWAEELAPKDVYHDPGLDWAGMSPEVRGDVSSTHRKRDALDIVRFETLLPTTDEPLKLLAKSGPYTLPVRINCLRRLLRAHDTASGSLRDGSWQELLAVIRNEETDVHNRVLAIRACIAEQVTPPTLAEFSDFLNASAPHLADPLVLGGVMAFTRLAFGPGGLSAPWKQEDIRGAISKVQQQTNDPDVQSHLTSLVDWLTGAQAVWLGSAVMHLRKALFSRPGHQNAADEVDTLANYLRDLCKNTSLDTVMLRAIPAAAMRVVDRFSGLERSARVLLPHVRNQPTEEWQHLLSGTQSKLEVLSRLIWLNPAADLLGTSGVAREAHAALSYLKSKWLATETGYARMLLEPFFQPVLPLIRDAIVRGEGDYMDEFPSHRVLHDHESFEVGTGAMIEVLCHPTVLADAIRNIVSNIWKHVVPHSIKKKQDTIVTWICEVTPRIATIRVVDNGPGISEEDYNRDGNGGYDTIAPAIKEYDGVYGVQTDSPSGARVTLQLHWREVTP